MASQGKEQEGSPEAGFRRRHALALPGTARAVAGGPRAGLGNGALLMQSERIRVLELTSSEGPEQGGTAAGVDAQTRRGHLEMGPISGLSRVTDSYLSSSAANVTSLQDQPSTHMQKRQQSHAMKQQLLMPGTGWVAACSSSATGGCTVLAVPSESSLHEEQQRAHVHEQDHVFLGSTCQHASAVVGARSARPDTTCIDNSNIQVFARTKAPLRHLLPPGTPGPQHTGAMSQQPSLSSIRSLTYQKPLLFPAPGISDAQARPEQAVLGCSALQQRSSNTAADMEVTRAAGLLASEQRTRSKLFGSSSATLPGPAEVPKELLEASARELVGNGPFPRPMVCANASLEVQGRGKQSPPSLHSQRPTPRGNRKAMDGSLCFPVVNGDMGSTLEAQGPGSTVPHGRQHSLAGVGCSGQEGAAGMREGEMDSGRGDWQGARSRDGQSKKKIKLRPRLWCSGDGYECRDCGMIFSNAQALGGHMTAHTKRRRSNFAMHHRLGGPESPLPGNSNDRTPSISFSHVPRTMSVPTPSVAGTGTGAMVDLPSFGTRPVASGEATALGSLGRIGFPMSLAQRTMLQQQLTGNMEEQEETGAGHTQPSWESQGQMLSKYQQHQQQHQQHQHLSPTWQHPWKQESGSWPNLSLTPPRVLVPVTASAPAQVAPVGYAPRNTLFMLIPVAGLAHSDAPESTQSQGAAQLLLGTEEAERQRSMQMNSILGMVTDSRREEEAQALQARYVQLHQHVLSGQNLGSGSLASLTPVNSNEIQAPMSSPRNQFLLGATPIQSLQRWNPVLTGPTAAAAAAAEQEEEGEEEEEEGEGTSARGEATAGGGGGGSPAGDGLQGASAVDISADSPTLFISLPAPVSFPLHSSIPPTASLLPNNQADRSMQQTLEGDATSPNLKELVARTGNCHVVAPSSADLLNKSFLQFLGRKQQQLQQEHLQLRQGKTQQQQVEEELQQRLKPFSRPPADLGASPSVLADGTKSNSFALADHSLCTQQQSTQDRCDIRGKSDHVAEEDESHLNLSLSL